MTQVLFAHLQFGIQKSYNPVTFVEAMKLDKAEQQDAQEFVTIFFFFFFFLTFFFFFSGLLRSSPVVCSRFSKLFLTYLEGLLKQRSIEVIQDQVSLFLILHVGERDRSKPSAALPSSMASTLM